MKKLIVLIIMLVLSLSLAACGGSGGSGEPSQDASAPETSDVTPVSKEVNFTALLVPSDFAEFQTVDGGTAVAEGQNSNSIVTNTNETLLQLQVWMPLSYSSRVTVLQAAKTKPFVT